LLKHYFKKLKTQPMASKTDTLSNYFGDIQTAHVYAYYKNGSFYDYETHEKVVLEERHPEEPFDKNKPSGTLVKIIVPLHKTTQIDYEKHQKWETKCLLPANTRVVFEMEQYGWSERLHFVASLKEDLLISKKGNKEWKLNSCSCVLIGGRRVQESREFETEPIEAASLNQLFTQVSIKYRPHSNSHNCNVFKIFRVYETGELLNLLRSKIES
jgi:hypothetical protein